MRLNGWMRLGIVVTALWVVSVCFWAAYEFYVGPLGSDYYLVVMLPSVDQLLAPSKYQLVEPAFNEYNFFKLLLGPPVIAWTAAFASLFAYKWISAGFKNGKEK